jgi:chromosome segregation ATPase
VLLQSPLGDVEERFQRMEAEKEQLRLQVSVLAEQVDAQTEKMMELERMLDDKKRALNKAEETLQLVSNNYK